MKVMHLLQSTHFSGAENVVCQIFSMFSNDENIEMVYVSRKGTIEDALKERKIPYHGLNNLNIVSVRKVIKEIKPDIIHAHDVSASIISSIASIGLKCKVISHMHVNNNNMSKLNLKTMLYRMSCFRYEHIFWVSNSCFDNYYFKQGINNKSSILSNVMVRQDIVEKKEKDTRQYSYDIVYVGRLSYQKNPERLVKVISAIKKEIPGVKVAIVGGNGELVNETANLIKQLGLGETVDMVGFMSNPLKLMSDSKLMLMTSRYEGLPMCVLEAMALGVPVVSTPVDGLKDVIENDINGYLEESDDGLILRSIEIIKDSALRNRLSEKTMKRFIEENDAKKYKNAIFNEYIK